MHLLNHKGEERGHVRFLNSAELADRKRVWQGYRPVIYDPDGRILNRLEPGERIIEGAVVGSWNDNAPVDSVDGDTATISQPSVKSTKPIDPLKTIDRVIEDVAKWVLDAKDNAPLLAQRVKWMRQWNPDALQHKTDSEVISMLSTEVTRARMQTLTQGIYKRMGWDRGAAISADGSTLPVGADV